MKSTAFLVSCLACIIAAPTFAQSDCSTFNDCGNIADDLFRNGSLDSAIIFYDKAINSWKEEDGIEAKSQAIINRGRVYGYKAIKAEDDELWAQSLQNYMQAIEVAPNMYFPYVAIAVYYQSKEQDDLALTFFDKAVEAEPNNARAYFERGYRFYYKSEKYEEAVKDMQKAVDLTTSRSYDKESGTFSMRVVDRSISANARAEYRYYLGEAYEYLKGAENDQKALDAYTSAIQEDPSYVWAYYRRGRLFRIYKKYEAAMQDLDKTIQLKPDHAGAHYNRSDVLYGQQKYNEALTGYLKAANLNPESYGDSYVMASTCYLVLKQYDNTIKYANEGLKYEMHKYYIALAFYNRGYAYWYKGQTNYTISDFKKAVDYGNQDARNLLKNSFKINY